MRIGLFLGELLARPLDDVLAGIRQAADEGFASAWLPQVFGYDTLTVLALAGHSTPSIELGTAVVPTYPRHPMMLAGQALTVQAATGGRLARHRRVPSGGYRRHAGAFLRAAGSAHEGISVGPDAPGQRRAGLLPG
jgi:hypothetical protein